MLRQLRLQLLARAVQPGHDGAHRHPQRLRDLDVAFMLDVKERNHLAVARRQRGDGALQVALRFLFLGALCTLLPLALGVACLLVERSFF